MGTCLEQRPVIRLSPYNTRQLKFINLTSFMKALQQDTDLAAIDTAILPQVIQTLYVVTGCDYIPFFSHIGKSTFLSSFFQYA